MPTPPLMQLPKTTSAEEFECICTDILTLRKDSIFKRYGRSGQCQNGIDIIYKNSNNKYIVVQCKNYLSLKSDKKLIKKIKEDINSSSQLPFYNDITNFIVMTSMNRDNKVQNEIGNFNVNFNIELYFWEDIELELCQNPSLLYKYYPTLFHGFNIPIDVLNKIISNINILKSISENFKNNFKTYKLAANFESDKNVYNNCVLMFNTAIDLSNIKDKYYLQIKKLKVLDNIDIILKSIPSIYDENNDGTGANMIATIDDYISYFMNNKSFIENCNTIIDKLSTK